MKISIIMKPRHSGIRTIFKDAWYITIPFKYFDWFINKNLYIDEVPRDKVWELYEELQAMQWPQKVILAVRGAFLDTGEQKKTSYFEDIEKMILQ